MGKIKIKLQPSFEPDACPHCKEKMFARLEVIRFGSLSKRENMTIYEYCLNPVCSERDYIVCDDCGEDMEISQGLPHLPYCDNPDCKSNNSFRV